MRIRFRGTSGNIEVISCECFGLNKNKCLFITTQSGKNQVYSTKPLKDEDKKNFELWTYRFMVTGFLDLVNSGYVFMMS